MLIKYFYDERLAQASYLVGCQASGTAVVIDPARNISPYLEVAQQHGLRIEFVTETHIHADFVSGTRELAHATGALMLLSGEGGADWSYQFPDENVRLLHDGESFMVGNLRLDVWHTPGHTPEHISFLLTDNGADAPIGIFSGDFLFAGDIGRPDLLEEAAGIMGTREQGARLQFANVQRLKQMEDYLQVWPGHGAGSACGKALGAVPSSTVGYEKRFNPAFRFQQEAEFVTWLLEGQPEAPRYFGRMKYVNKVGPALLRDLPQAQHINDVPDSDIIPQSALFIDTRPLSDFASKHIAGSVSIPIDSNSFSTYVGWYVDYDQPTFFVAYHNDVMEVINALFAIGVDDVRGYFTNEALALRADSTIKTQSPQAIYEAGIRVLDVRGESEYQSGHIPNAMHIHMGKVLQHLDQLPRQEPLAVQCGGGLRSQVVVSLLQKEGFTNLINMDGGIDGWKSANLPIE